MSIEITVRGEHEVRRLPERATAVLAVRTEGASGGEAQAHLGAAAARVADSLRALHDPQHGPVTWWSSDTVRSGARRPSHDKGKQLPLVHWSSQGFSAKFSDFERLGAWLTASAVIPGFSVSGVSWTLTEALRGTLVVQARHQAVRAARARAQDYADAAGLGQVRLVALADAGMLGQGLNPVHASPSAPVSRMAAAAAGQETSFAPEDVVVGCRVDARFLAD